MKQFVRILRFLLICLGVGVVLTLAALIAGVRQLSKEVHSLNRDLDMVTRVLDQTIDVDVRSALSEFLANLDESHEFNRMWGMVVRLDAGGLTRHYALHEPRLELSAFRAFRCTV